MSADRWTVCPRCVRNREAALARRAEQVEAMYGKASMAEFDQARADLAAEKSGTIDMETFREDYEIYGAEDGEVKVTYSGRCSTCHLSLEFTHTHPLDVDGAS